MEVLGRLRTHFFYAVCAGSSKKVISGPMNRVLMLKFGKNMCFFWQKIWWDLLAAERFEALLQLPRSWWVHQTVTSEENNYYIVQFYVTVSKSGELGQDVLHLIEVVFIFSNNILVTPLTIQEFCKRKEWVRIIALRSFRLCLHANSWRVIHKLRIALKEGGGSSWRYASDIRNHIRYEGAGGKKWTI